MINIGDSMEANCYIRTFLGHNWGSVSRPDSNIKCSFIIKYPAQRNISPCTDYIVVWCGYEQGICKIETRYMKFEPSWFETKANDVFSSTSYVLIYLTLHYTDLSTRNTSIIFSRKRVMFISAFYPR